MGPALLRRFWTVKLEPTKQDWLDWAKGSRGMSEAVVEFISHHGSHLRHSGQFEPGKVYPNPASWDRLERSLVHAEMSPDDICGTGNLPDGFYAMSMGFVGVEAAIAFVDFVKNFESQVSAEDVLERWKDQKIQKKVKSLSTDKHNSIIQKLSDHCKANDWDLSQARNASDFVKGLSGEMLVSFFNSVLESNNVPNIRLVHKFLGNLVVDIVSAAEKL